MSFTWTELIPGVGAENAPMATAAIVTGGLILTGLLAKSKLGNLNESAEPAPKFSLKGIFELITEFITGLCDSIIGHNGRVYIPLFGSIFVFVLVNNLVGLLPGMSPATETINCTLAIGIFSFLAYNYFGFRENGKDYLKHFFGPLLWLIPIMLPIEIISHLVRPLSLGLRLANVMKGDHLVVGTFLDLVPVLVPIPFYLLGLFISVIQAFVFTLLSMVYIAMATAHDH